MKPEDILFEFITTIINWVSISVVILFFMMIAFNLLKAFLNKNHIENEYKNKKIHKILQLDFDVYKKWLEINRLLIENKAYRFNEEQFKNIHSCIINDAVKGEDFTIIRERINCLLIENKAYRFNEEQFKDVNSCIVNDTVNSVDFTIIFDIYQEFLKDIRLDEFKKEDIISIEKRGIITRKINEMNEYLHMVIKKEVAILQDTYQKDEFEEIEELLAIYKDKYNEGKGA